MSDLITEINEGIFQELELHPVTRHLVERLLWDLPLTPAQCTDFGVVSENHYRALRAVLVDNAEQEDAEETYHELRRRIVELDNAYGNGPMLNALIKQYAPEYAKLVKFSTSWDVIFGRIEADPLQSE
jgi:hypothetical protein